MSVQLVKVSRRGPDKLLGDMDTTSVSSNGKGEVTIYVAFTLPADEKSPTRYHVRGDVNAVAGLVRTIAFNVVAFDERLQGRDRYNLSKRSPYAAEWLCALADEIEGRKT